jgi:glycosyltransferase involved in cell wall biosynthesis
MTRPYVTVIIPTRNRRSFLPLALRSALSQEEVAVEVIVVDDSSTDDTSAYLGSIRDPRLRILGHASHQGVAKARNTGIAAAQGDWLAFLDDDDLWSPRKLTSQLRAAEARNAVFAYSSAVVLTENRQPLQVLPAPDPEELVTLLLRRSAIPAGSSNVIARTDVVRHLGAFDEHLFQLADWDLWIRLAQVDVAAASGEVLVGYCQHPGNMMLFNQRTAPQEFHYLCSKHGNLLAGSGANFDRVGFTRWIAWAYRRTGRRLEAATVYMGGALKYGSGGNVARAFGAILGERAMALRHTEEVPSAPVWLDFYR